MKSYLGHVQSGNIFATVSVLNDMFPPNGVQCFATGVGLLLYCGCVGGVAMQFYLHCRLDGHPCWVLIDTVSQVRPETLPNARWELTNTQLKSVTDQTTGMRGRRKVSVAVGCQQEQYEFWLADIDEACIVELYAHHRA